MSSRASRFVSVFLVGAVAAFVAVVSPLASAGSLARTAKPRSLVLSPRSGQTVRSYPVTVRVRAGDGSGDFRATLNGHPIGSQFGAAQQGIRSLEVSVSQGLKRGPNVLRERVRQSSGRRSAATVRFRLSVKGPLAGAGPDTRVIVGSPYMLMGTGAAGSRKPAVTGSATFHWTLISHPPNIGELGLSDPTAPDSKFVPDVPGPYTLQLTYRDSRGSTSDTVTLDAVLPSPRVPIQTMATEDGVPGIKVGPQFYPARTSVSVGYPYWQVVVLDRSTLGLVSNKTYACPSPAPCESDQIASDLGHLNDTKLVIASLQPGSNHLVLTDLNEFKRIGAPSLNGQHIPRGYASLIGVPGLPQGQAQARLIPDDHQASGDMVGYLTPDQYFNYTWLPVGRVPFDTRAEDTGATDNAIQVGGLVYRSQLKDATGGYHVVVLDGYTLALRGDAFFQTNQSSTSAATTADKQMTDFLKTKVRAGDLVFVNAMSQHGQPPLSVGADRSALGNLASAVASVGGTRDLFNRSGIKADSNYSLIGWGAAGEGNGQETSLVNDPVPGDGRLRGVLTPDRRSLFKPTTSSAFGEPPEALANLILQPSTPWPLDGNTGAQNAIVYIGSHNVRLGADPRAAYWTQPFDQGTWDAIASEVKDMSYPAGQGFTDADFKAAQSELVQEITWVGHVRAYLKNLSSPFADNVITSWSKLTTITDKVIDALKPPEQKGALLALDIFGGMLSIGGVAGGPVVESVAVAYEVALSYLVQDRAGGDQDTITGNAHELADHLVTLLENAQAGFQSLGNIVVSDYGALKTVGTLGGCSATAPDCPKEWEFSQPGKRAAATAAYKSIQAEFDQALMKLAFPAYTLGARGNHRAPDGHVSNNARDFPCLRVGKFYPFDNEQDNGQVALLEELPDQYDVLALANLSNLNALNYKPNLPPQSVLVRMFSALSDSLDPTAGGLGIDKADFMREANKGDYETAAKNAFFFYPACGTGNWNG